MPDGSEDADPATRAWDESDHLEEKYQEPETDVVDDKYSEPDVHERFDIGPEPPFPDDVDPELHSRFWSLVFIFNVAVLAVSVGGLFMLFGTDFTLGGQLVLGGAVVGVYGLYRYRITKQALLDDQNG